MVNAMQDFWYWPYRSKPVTIFACGPITERRICHTHNGDAWAEVGHYVIQEPDGVGEYPCDPETFARRWERDVENVAYVETRTA